MRWLWMLGCVAVFAAAVGGLPGLAGADATPTVAADNNFFSPMTSAVVTGASVRFADVTPVSFQHNVDFVAGPAKPQCDGLPTTPSAGAWSGTCTFTKPGTYTFVCDKHGGYDPATRRGTGMYGTVTVSGLPQPTTTTPGTTPMSTGGQPAGGALRLGASRRGPMVRASVEIAGPGSHLLAELLRGRVRLGRLARAVPKAGRVRFGVRLSARGRALLKVRQRLMLTLRVTITPPTGPSVVLRAAVKLRA